MRKTQMQNTDTNRVRNAPVQSTDTNRKYKPFTQCICALSPRIYTKFSHIAAANFLRNACAHISPYFCVYTSVYIIIYLCCIFKGNEKMNTEKILHFLLCVKIIKPHYINSLPFQSIKWSPKTSEHTFRNWECGSYMSVYGIQKWKFRYIFFSDADKIE